MPALRTIALAAVLVAVIVLLPTLYPPNEPRPSPLLHGWREFSSCDCWAIERIHECAPPKE